jgi:hypothetical protein
MIQDKGFGTALNYFSISPTGLEKIWNSLELMMNEKAEIFFIKRSR